MRRFSKLLRPADAEAQDLVQETVERALSRRETFRPGSRLDSWVFTLMKRIAIDKGRSQARWAQVVSSDDDASAHQADPGQADETLRLDAMATRQAILDLPADQREAVALVLIEGFSYADAAGILGVPAGTLTSRLVRGRQALISRLSEQGVGS